MKDEGFTLYDPEMNLNIGFTECGVKDLFISGLSHRKNYPRTGLERFRLRSRNTWDSSRFDLRITRERGMRGERVRK